MHNDSRNTKGGARNQGRDVEIKALNGYFLQGKGRKESQIVEMLGKSGVSKMKKEDSRDAKMQNRQRRGIARTKSNV
jgi:hypothetical protein